MATMHEVAPPVVGATLRVKTRPNRARRASPALGRTTWADAMPHLPRLKMRAMTVALMRPSSKVRLPNNFLSDTDVAIAHSAGYDAG